jgi:hypothetical protein
VVEHFHGKEGVSSSNLEGGSIFMKIFPVPKNPNADMPDRRVTALTRTVIAIGGVAASAVSFEMYSSLPVSAISRDMYGVTGVFAAISAIFAIADELEERYKNRGGGWNGGGGDDFPVADPPSGPRFGAELSWMREVETYLEEQSLVGVDQRG